MNPVVLAAILLLLLLLQRAARQQLDPDCFQLSSIGRTATRDFRNGVTAKVSGALFSPPLVFTGQLLVPGDTEAPFSGFTVTTKVSRLVWL